MADGIQILSPVWKDYELLDTGNKLKLERFGHCIVVRSEPKAWWNPQRPELWKNANAHFLEEGRDSRWQFSKKVSAPVIEFNGLKFLTKFMDGSKHLGVFPEQKPHWEFVQQKIKTFKPFVASGVKVEKPRVLNLFGYTGAASLSAAKAGAFVTHVDASKPSVEWARKNQELSGVDKNSIRWILDDALKFVKRQERRGSKYEGIILDPPSFGRGPRNELWKLDKMLPELLESCANILSEKPMFVLMTLYSIEASSIMAANMLSQYFSEKQSANIDYGELVLTPNFQGGMRLPLSLWAKAVW